MKILNPRVHGYLDYVVVLLFASAPSVFGFSGLPATISYALAGIHLVLTLLTAFPLGIVKMIPFTVHGSLELVVTILLIVLPWLAGFSEDPSARNFYLGSAGLIFIVWLLTDYKAADQAPYTTA